VESAHERIRPYIHRTPVFTSAAINQLTARELYFKCENFQKVGAFKYRGATNAVLKLGGERLHSGVATHSSGNHAAALALAARTQGSKAWIVMPRTAPQVKIDAVKGYGARIVFCDPTLESRESTLEKVVEETGATFVHPFDNFDVVAGQGTAAKEFLEEVPDLDAVITPVGGGGLLSGTAITGRYLKPRIKIFAAEPENADDAYRSFKENRLIPSDNPQTIADGLLTSLSPLTFEIIRSKVDDIFTASEHSIIRAMMLIWERMKIIVEPSAVLPLAVLIQHGKSIPGERMGLILSGGNVDFRRIHHLFESGNSSAKMGK
jgi:threonine dehydratase